MPKDQKSPLQVMRHSNKYYALGLACEVLRGQLPFSDYKFGQFSSTLLGQLKREHYLFTRQDKKLLGYAGWGLTNTEIAEKMLSENYTPTYDECLSGSCWLGLTFYAINKEVCDFQARQIRLLYPNRHFYFRREYPNRPPRMIKVFNFSKIK